MGEPRHRLHDENIMNRLEEPALQPLQMFSKSPCLSEFLSYTLPLDKLHLSESEIRAGAERPNFAVIRAPS